MMTFDIFLSISDSVELSGADYDAEHSKSFFKNLSGVFLIVVLSI